MLSPPEGSVWPVRILPLCLAALSLSATEKWFCWLVAITMSPSPRQNSKPNVRRADGEKGERHNECIIAQVWKTNRERSGDNMSRSARDIINRVPFPSQKCLVRTINYLVTGNIRNKLPFLSQGQAERTPGVERVTAQWSWATCGYHSRSRPSVQATPAKQT